MAPDAGDEAPRMSSLAKPEAEDCVRFVTRHQRSVRRWFAVRLEDPTEADDLAQEVFIVAFRKAPQSQSDRVIRGWLLGIARNLYRNYCRRPRARPHVDQQLCDLLDQRVGSILERHEGLEEEMAGALRACVLQLGPRAREMVEQRFVEGCSVQQLGARTGMKNSAVTMALYRIRRQLRQCIENRLEPERGT
jgi:RNA polymerase sigma-70 factor (ECF subfamily)